MSIVLDRAGMERLPTSRTMAATTVISARVNPACRAQASPDLYLAFTGFSAFPNAMFELKANNAFEQLSPGPLHIAHSQILTWRAKNLLSWK
jgi:hypothetical protein